MHGAEWLLVAALGVLAGLAGGMLGIAGSIIMIPGLGLIFGQTEPGVLHLHTASAMLVNAFVLAPAVWQHFKARAVMPQIVRWTIPASIAGALLGVKLSNSEAFRGGGQGWLQLLFAAFLIYVVFYNVWRLLPHAPRDGDANAAHRRKFGWFSVVGLIGLPTGLVGGLLGVGGGIYAVPVQQALFRIPLRQAIANSATTIIWSSAVAAVSKNLQIGLHGWAFSQTATFAAVLIPGALLGGYCGGWLVHRLPIGAIRLFVLLMLSFAAWRLCVWGIANVMGQ